MEHARRDQPAGAPLEPVGLRVVKDAVVTFVPVLEAAAEILLRGARLEAHEGVGEVVVTVVVLRRKVVALGLALLADELRVVERLVHVVGDRPHVVEELRVDRPLFVAVPDALADELRPSFAHGVAEQEPLTVEHAPGETLVGNPALVGRLGRAREPPLVDAAAVETVGVVVVGMEADPLAGVEKAPRHPRRREPDDALAGIHRVVERGADVFRLGELGGGAASGGGGHGASLLRKEVPERAMFVRIPGNGRKNRLDSARSPTVLRRPALQLKNPRPSRPLHGMW